MSRFIVTVFIWICFHIGQPCMSATGFEKISMQIGGQKPVNWSRVLRATVSRRGIIHLIDQDQDTWHITALRTGVVAVTLYFKGGKRRVVYVEVSPKENPRVRTVVSTVATQPPQPSEPTIIYRCHVRVELIESHELESVGGGSKANVLVDLPAQKVSPTAVGRFESDNTSSTRKVLASPLFLLSDGEEAEIKSGGETLHLDSANDGENRSIWHEFGMNLNVKITQKAEGRHRADVLFVLRTPTTDGQYSLNQIQTTSLIKIDQNQLIGTVDLSTADEGTSKDIFLSQVPIIGPLFRHKTTSAAKATLRLWLEIGRG